MSILRLKMQRRKEIYCNRGSPGVYIALSHVGFGRFRVHVLRSKVLGYLGGMERCHDYSWHSNDSSRMVSRFAF